MNDIDVGALIREARLRAGLAQADLAKRAGTSQPAIARWESGGSSPTIATLERVLGAAGFALRLALVPKVAPDPLVEAYKRDVDRTLLRENLRRSIDDRLRSLEDLQRFGRELDNAGKRRGKRSAR